MTKEQLLNWNLEVERYLEEKELQEILHSTGSYKSFNADESAFFLNPKGGKVLVRRGDKTVYQGAANDEKECITTLINGSADLNI